MYVAGDCEICPECGAELIPRKPADRPEKTLFAGYDFQTVFSQIKQGFAGEDSGVGLSERSKNMAEKIDSEKNDTPSQDECPYLEVAYNRNLFFLSGSESIMKLRLIPKDVGLRHVLVFLEIARAETNIRRQIPVKEILRKDRPFYLQIPFLPDQASGCLAITYYIGCQTGRGIFYYQFSVEHKVYDPNQSGANLGRQVIINTTYTAGDNASIDTSVRASEAGEINSRNVVEDAIRQLGHDPSVHELIDRLNELPPDFEVKRLAETIWRPEDMMVNGNIYPADRLLLEWNDLLLFFIGKTCVKLGRDPKKVDLVIHSGGDKLGSLEYPNSTVSRLHAEILYCGDSVKFFDRSSFGTYINGRKPDSAGIPVQDTALVEFGDIHWQMNMQRCAMRSSRDICQTCRAEQIKSVTFTRTDGEKEYYFLVWQCCELGQVIEALSDWSVFFRNGAFFIRTPEQEFRYLRPGQIIESGSQKIQVKYFHQKQP